MMTATRMGVDDGVRRQDAEPSVRRSWRIISRDGGLADPAKGERGQGDSELDGGKKLVDVVLELEERCGRRGGRAR